MDGKVSSEEVIMILHEALSVCMVHFLEASSHVIRYGCYNNEGTKVHNPRQ